MGEDAGAQNIATLAALVLVHFVAVFCNGGFKVLWLCLCMSRYPLVN